MQSAMRGGFRVSSRVVIPVTTRRETNGTISRFIGESSPEPAGSAIAVSTRVATYGPYAGVKHGPTLIAYWNGYWNLTSP